MNENTVYAEAWSFVRDLYAPTMTAPEAVKRLEQYMQGNGHQVVRLNKTTIVVDDETFVLIKPRKHMHFDLLQKNSWGFESQQQEF